MADRKLLKTAEPGYDKQHKAIRKAHLAQLRDGDPCPRRDTGDCGSGGPCDPIAQPMQHKAELNIDGRSVQLDQMGSACGERASRTRAQVRGLQTHVGLLRLGTRRRNTRTEQGDAEPNAGTSRGSGWLSARTGQANTTTGITARALPDLRLGPCRPTC